MKQKLPIYDLSSHYGDEVLHDVVCRGMQGWILRAFDVTSEDPQNFYTSLANTYTSFFRETSGAKQLDLFLSLYLFIYRDVFSNDFSMMRFKNLFLSQIELAKSTPGLEENVYFDLMRRISKTYNDFVDGYQKFLADKLKASMELDFYAQFSKYLFADADALNEFKRDLSATDKLLFFERVKPVYLKYLAGAYPNLDVFNGIFAHSNYSGLGIGIPFQVFQRGEDFNSYSSSQVTCLPKELDYGDGNPLTSDVNVSLLNMGISPDEADFTAMTQSVLSDGPVNDGYPEMRGTTEGRQVLFQKIAMVLNDRTNGGRIFE